MKAQDERQLLPGDRTQLVLLGGLPGSGKTALAGRLERNGWFLRDDFQSGARDDSPSFRASKHYGSLVRALRSGRKCVISDVRVIHDSYRQDVVASLAKDVGPIETEVHLFENDPKQCAENVRQAADGRRLGPRLEAIAFWTHHYSLPPGGVLHPVWRPRR